MEAGHYIDDRFGGHLSVRGNRLVAEKIAEVLAPVLATADSPAKTREARP